MVNYELPWNPNRIEQRIGRLHRYGQKRDVQVHNLFVTNTREDRILQRLLERLEQIRADMPGEVYDVLGSLLAGVNLQELIMNALAENRPPEVTAEQAARAAEERARMLAVVERDLLLDVRRYNHEEALRILKDARRASATTDDLRRLAEAFLTSRGARIRPARAPGLVKITGVPASLQRPGVQGEYEKAMFDRAVARSTRPDEVDFIALSHPLFDAIVDACRDLELEGVATVKRVPAKTQVGLVGLLASFVLEFTDGMNQTVTRRFHQVFVDLEGRSRPEVLPEIPTLTSSSLELPALSPAVQRALGEVPRLAEDAGAFEEEIQAARSRLVSLMRSDLETYARVKEARLKEDLSEAQRRLREGREQLALLVDDEERRRLEATLRLREYEVQRRARARSPGGQGAAEERRTWKPGDRGRRRATVGKLGPGGVPIPGGAMMARDETGHPTEGLPRGVNNQGLFSDYYLTELVREDTFFIGSTTEAENVWPTLKFAYEKVKVQLDTANKAQTEELFIRPVLDALGYKGAYAVQPEVPSPEGHRRPDYAFFPNAEDLGAGLSQRVEPSISPRPSRWATPRRGVVPLTAGTRGAASRSKRLPQATKSTTTFGQPTGNGGF